MSGLFLLWWSRTARLDDNGRMIERPIGEIAKTKTQGRRDENDDGKGNLLLAHSNPAANFFEHTAQSYSSVIKF